MHDIDTFLLLAILILICWPWAKEGDKRLRRVERKLDAIAKHLNIDLAPGVDPKIIELVCAGKKIEAIKLYREKTGVGLKEAKDVVDSL